MEERAARGHRIEGAGERLDAVGELVRLAKGLFGLGETEWEDPVWDVTTWCRNRSKTVRWRFITEEGVSFDPGFGDVVKAALVYEARVNAKSPKTLVSWLIPIRAFYEVIRQHSGESAPPWAWDKLTLGDWRRAENLVSGKVSPSSRYLFAGGLQTFAALLEARGIVGRTLYRHRQARPRDASTRHIEDREAAMEKLPPMPALHALADASREPKNDRDRALFAIVGLMLALGFRVGEVLTLPADCWRVNAEGKPYLTYWPEKGAPLSPKWIPGAAVELVQGSIGTLLTLTGKARQRARALEADPTRVPLLGDHSPTELLGTVELSEAMGMSRSGVLKYLGKLDIPPSTRRGGANGKGWSWEVDGLERALVKDLPEHRYKLATPAGGEQRLSEHLCLTPKIPRNGKPSLLMVRPIPASSVEGFLDSRRACGQGSVFERYGLVDDDGEPWSVSTHQFRHWLNTVAHKGGLPDLELARWMGRRDPRQNRQYQHLNAEERRERVKEAVRAEEMVGPASEVYRRLPADEREPFLEAAIEAANVTPYGTCTHNFATKPCPYHVQCLNGCGSFLRTKGSQREIIAIENIKRRAERNVEAAKVAEQHGLPEAANWIDHERRLLEGANHALAVEDVQESATGERVVAVFPEAPSFGDPGQSGMR